MKLLMVLFAPILTGLLFLFPSAASASPCANGSLQSYILLGASGCTIDDKIFSNFSYVPSPLGPNPTTGLLPPGVTFLSNPSADQVRVVPLDTPADPGLQFTGGWGIDGIAIPALIFGIGFNVTVLPEGDLIKDESLFLLGSSRRFGSIGIVDVRDGDPLFHVFIPPLGGPPQQLSATRTFTPVSTVAVNLTGAASFGLIDSFQENFSEVVPEPSTWLLLGSGFIGLVMWRRRQHIVHVK